MIYLIWNIPVTVLVCNPSDRSCVTYLRSLLSLGNVQTGSTRQYSIPTIRWRPARLVIKYDK